jgi:hypothetical protein
MRSTVLAQRFRQPFPFLDAETKSGEEPRLLRRKAKDTNAFFDYVADGDSDRKRLKQLIHLSIAIGK